MYKKAIIFTLLLALLTGCSAAAPPQSQSYEDIKKSTLDALQTEEGKKVIRKLLEDPAMKDMLVLEHDDVNSAIEDTLLSKKAEEYWKTQFEDPKFRETFAKSLKKEQKDLLKDLMKDASFQKDLEQFFSQPDMQKQLEKIMKSASSKEDLEKVIAEVIKSPMLQDKWAKLIESSGEKSKSSDGGGGSDGGQGGGGGGSGKGVGGK
ncbi:spore germination lipoprotein GerD [Rummeliibacillus stabekisii]|uniref:spore germination lipoprotein GerD n=1 Tax=Rummeliibacillus stabekisii TaxID=241244 RepID=UPI00203CB4F7|nr:spore germination lipoprotein GerD [Rummeliibacillus stabekisii]MCM3317731.1 spore germination lipoprotein GerD [Rummeliibacillus stabekisii]